jgi:gliding motility-associated-like protein
MKKLVSSLFLVLSACYSYGQQITIDQTQTPNQLVNNVLVGSGVVIQNVTYNYSIPDANVNQTTIGYFNNNGTNFPISEGVILGTGNVILAVGPNNAGGSTNNSGVANPDPSDPDLAAIGSATMNNECILEFDFIPSGDSIVFNYIFASEEYHEYAPSSFNDAFGFFISGPGFAGPYSGGAENIAYIPGTSTPVTINNLNNGNSNTGPCVNCQYLTDNTGGQAIQYDAHTVVMQAAASVICGQTYHIKIAIADAGDQAFDSAVFLEASSFSSNGVSVSIASATGSAAITESCDSAIVTFTRPENSDTVALTYNYNVGGTAINGTDYNNLTGTVTFPIGVDTVQFYITPVADGLTEGTETVELSVDIINACGDTITTTAIIEITDPLPFNVITSDTTITCPTDSILISATTDGGIPQLNFTWLSGETNDSIWVPALNTGTTTYTVNVLDACGVTSQGTIDVNVNPAPQPTIDFAGAAAGQNITLCPGQQFNIQILQVNNPYDASAITYNWHPEISNINQVTVTAQPNAFFEYVDVFDGCYTVIDSVKINPGGVTINQINVVDALNCPGQPAPALGEIEIIPTGYTYTLTGGGLNVGPQPSNQFTNLTGGLTYFVHVEDVNGCFTDTAVFVGTAITSVTADWITTTLDSVTCNGTQDGSAEVGNIQGGLTPGPYDITWTHQTGDYSQVIGTGVGTGDVVDTLYGGQWVVSVVEQGSGCAWSQTFEIYEPNPIFIDTSNYHMPYCFGNSDGVATINVTGGNTYQDYLTIEGSNSANTIVGSTTTSPLTLNNLGTDTYTIYVEDIKGCKDSVNLFIDQPAELSIDFTVTDITCYGINTGVIAIDTVYNYQYPNFDSLSYIWNPIPASGLQGIGAYFNNHLAAGVYEIQITDYNDLQTHCIKTFSFTVEDASPIIIEDYVVTKIPLCRTATNQDAHGQISVTVSGGLTTSGTGNDFTNSYWQNNSTGSTWNSTTYPGINSGYYTFYAVNELNCVVDTTFYLDSISPVANFIATSPQFTSNYVGTATVEVTFENTSENYDYANNPGYNGNNTNSDVDTLFTWYFTDADDNTEIIHTESLAPIVKDYLSEGLYTVCLEVEENLNHCIDSTCIEIQIYDEPELIQANVFTPDGDGTNDYFYFPNQAIVDFSAVITDRWGNVVFEFNNIDTKWDGTNMKNGKMCTDGTYFYVYDGESSNGTKYKGQGTVQIIRKH